MYSLLLPSCFCDRSFNTLNRPAEWRRHGAVSAAWDRAMGRSSATGLLRVGAMARRQRHGQPASDSKWSLV